METLLASLCILNLCLLFLSVHSPGSQVNLLYENRTNTLNLFDHYLFQVNPGENLLAFMQIFKVWDLFSVTYKYI